jgi:metal-sulfur cluster biosynthetic enzyme
MPCSGNIVAFRMMDTDNDFGWQVYGVLSQVIDPEIGLNIVDLGLVYAVALTETGTIAVTMTLTTPGCPMGDAIQQGVVHVLKRNFPGHTVEVNLVWLPMWDSGMISKEGQAQLQGGYAPQLRDHGQSLWDRFF